MGRDKQWDWPGTNCRFAEVALTSVPRRGCACMTGGRRLHTRWRIEQTANHKTRNRLGGHLLEFGARSQPLFSTSHLLSVLSATTSSDTSTVGDTSAFHHSGPLVLAVWLRAHWRLARPPRTVRGQMMQQGCRAVRPENHPSIPRASRSREERAGRFGFQKNGDDSTWQAVRVQIVQTDADATIPD